MTDVNKQGPAVRPQAQDGDKPGSAPRAPAPMGLDEARMQSEGGGSAKSGGGRAQATSAASPLSAARDALPGSGPGATGQMPRGDAAPQPFGIGGTPITVDPIAETNYWRAAHSSRPSAGAGSVFEEYEPAYRMGWENAGRDPAATTFDSIEPRLSGGWDAAKGKSRLGWDQAKQAVRDAWDRAKQSVHSATAPGDKREGA